MACHDTVEVVTNSKVESQGSLHVQSLQACDVQAEERGDPIHDVLEVMVIVHGCEQLRASERIDYRFTIRHVEVVNLVLLEEFEDVLRGVERSLASGGVWQHSNPDSNASGNWLSATIPRSAHPTQSRRGRRRCAGFVVCQEVSQPWNECQSAGCYAPRRSCTSPQIVFQRLSSLSLL